VDGHRVEVKRACSVEEMQQRKGVGGGGMEGGGARGGFGHSGNMSVPSGMHGGGNMLPNAFRGDNMGGGMGMENFGGGMGNMRGEMGNMGHMGGGMGNMEGGMGNMGGGMGNMGGGMGNMGGEMGNMGGNSWSGNYASARPAVDLQQLACMIGSFMNGANNAVGGPMGAGNNGGRGVGPGAEGNYNQNAAGGGDCGAYDASGNWNAAMPKPPPRRQGLYIIH